MWETVGNTGRKGGALNQAWALLEPGSGDGDYVVTMDADTLLDPEFVEAAYAKYQPSGSKGRRSAASARTSPACSSTPRWARCR